MSSAAPLQTNWFPSLFRSLSSSHRSPQGLTQFIPSAGWSLCIFRRNTQKNLSESFLFLSLPFPPLPLALPEWHNSPLLLRDLTLCAPPMWASPTSLAFTNILSSRGPVKLSENTEKQPERFAPRPVPQGTRVWSRNINTRTHFCSSIPLLKLFISMSEAVTSCMYMF